MKYPSVAPVLLSLLAHSSKVLESHSFRQVSPARRLVARTPDTIATATTAAASTTSLQMGSVIGVLRGGAVLGTATSALTNALQAGPFGILGLTAIASAVVTPLTLYRQAYSFSVGYGLSAMVMGLALLRTFNLDVGGPALGLVGAMIFYGFRLTTFLLLREVTVPSKHEQIKSFDKTPVLKRIPFAVSVGLFYSFMATPALYLCRASGQLSAKATAFANAGVALAWFGAVVEAWTDTQKLLAKRSRDGSMDFHGPSKWWYGVSRHPNYFGELLFWFGLLMSGFPAFVAGGISSLTIGKIVPLVASLLGFAGIFQTMTGATNRLETKQDDKYGGQMAFEEWKSKTSKLAPTTKNLIGSILPVSISAGLAAFAIKAVRFLLAA